MTNRELICHRMWLVCVALALIVVMHSTPVGASAALSADDLKGVTAGCLSEYKCEKDQTCSVSPCGQHTGTPYYPRWCECRQTHTIHVCAYKYGYLSYCLKTQENKVCDCCRYYYDDDDQHLCDTYGVSGGRHGCSCNPHE